MSNLFSTQVQDKNKEHFEILLKTDHLKIEKIISNGQTSSQWYDQDEDEWVVLIEGEAELLFIDKSRVRLHKGEYLFIPKKKKHKVVYTSSPAIWLAIFQD